MIKRIYQMDELTESAEMLRGGPPWWVHAVLFGLILALLLIVTIVSTVIRDRLRDEARQKKAAPQTSVIRTVFVPGQRGARLLT